jgi:hypothetical protein
MADFSQLFFAHSQLRSEKINWKETKGFNPKSSYNEKRLRKNE